MLTYTFKTVNFTSWYLSSYHYLIVLQSDNIHYHNKTLRVTKAHNKTYYYGIMLDINECVELVQKLPTRSLTQVRRALAPHSDRSTT